jgi:fatty acid desaturase
MAAGLSMLWLTSLITILGRPLEVLPWWQCLLLILIRSQLHTGLFIIGHDAMHRVLWPRRPRLNDRLGAVACCTQPCPTATAVRSTIATTGSQPPAQIPTFQMRGRPIC